MSSRSSFFTKSERIYAMDTLFSNVTVVTMDEELRVLFSAFVGVTDGKIS